MSAKSLGTPPVIYAVDKLQNPLHRKTMFFEGETNSTVGRNDLFCNVSLSRVDTEQKQVLFLKLIHD